MEIKHAPNVKKITIIALTVIGIFIGGFMIWAVFAPLDSAAIAEGSIVVSGNRRTIQHLEGGIIKALYVQNGSHVKKNELLIKLDEVKAKAAAQIAQNQLWESLAIEARDYAELNNKTTITFPPELLHAKDSKALEVMKLQQAIFENNQVNFNGSIDIYKQRIEQLQQQIEGKKAQLRADEKQLAYINKELDDVKILAAKRLIKASRLLALEREAANLSGQQGMTLAEIGALEQKIGETKLEIIALNDKHRKEILTELRETDKNLHDCVEQLKASQDTLKRTSIRSPLDGTVVDLKFHTLGGVIKPGEPIMDIVPTHEDLVVEARLSPLDIDVVHKGLAAKIRFTGLSARNTPTLLAKVTEVSADVLTDPHTNKPYYSVRLTISHAELKKLNEQALYPGMPAEVMIIVKKATPWQYFTNPIEKSFNRAFREQ